MPNLQQLTDRLEITDLVTRLGRWLDGQGGDLATIYDRDAVVRSPRAELRGFDAVHAFLTREDPSGDRFQHFHSDVFVELAGDTAVVEANQLNQFFRPGQAPHRTSGLHVRYDVVRRPEGWRIASADIQLRWLIGDFPAA
jgi:hypothetical protein